MTWNVDTKEIISSTLTPLARSIPLDFKELEIIAGISYSYA
jgi:hypothetical protein